MTVTKRTAPEKLAEPKVALNPELKKFMDEESKLVSGRFKNYETPGGDLKLCCGKYPGQPLFKMTLEDGGIYKVPLWVARHLNGVDKTAKLLDGRIGSCSYPIHAFQWEANKSAPESQIGQGGIPVPIVGVGKRKQRFGFESLEFDAGAA
jgi:hypothetical protein